MTLKVPANTQLFITCSEFDIEASSMGQCIYGKFWFKLGNALTAPWCGSQLKNKIINSVPVFKTAYNFVVKFTSDSDGSGKGFDCKVIGKNKGVTTTTTTTTKKPDTVGGGSTQSKYISRPKSIITK